MAKTASYNWLEHSKYFKYVSRAINTLYNGSSSSEACCNHLAFQELGKKLYNTKYVIPKGVPRKVLYKNGFIQANGEILTSKLAILLKNIISKDINENIYTSQGHFSLTLEEETNFISAFNSLPLEGTNQDLMGNYESFE